MEIVAALIAGLVVGFLVGYHQRQAAARKPPPLERPANVQPLAPVLRLQQLTEALNAIADASSHPRDLEHNASFREAVALLESSDIDITAVTDYATGANWPLAAAACAALCGRGDRAQAVTTVLGVVRHLRPWTIYYALRYLNSLDERPPIGAVVLHCPDWWADHPLVPAFLAEHFTVRGERGDAALFGDGLAGATSSELSETESLLRRIDHPTARQLLEVLGSFRRLTVDRDYLQGFGRFVDSDPERALLVEHEAMKDQLAQAEACILQNPARSLLVVGDPRTGKTSFVSMLAMRAEAAGWTLFEASGAELQAGQIYIGQLEERLARLSKELAVEKRILWHVPNLLQLATSGTHKGQSASILDQLLPAIVGGRILLLGEIGPSALTKVLQLRPVVRTALELVRLRTLTDAETNRLAGQVAVRLAAHAQVELEPDVLDTTTYLARHYLGTGHMPGAVLDLLKLAVQRAVAHDAPRVCRDDVLATVAQLTGMPQQVLDDRERVDLASLRTFFSDRVIGQEEAVDAIVDRIAMLKAGLTDPGKPVAVFLFAGPTGTGKTELAKTLAAFLFGSADRLIRLDMSEFQTAETLRKIVGDAGDPDEGHALTDRVRKHPFSVVLLDEFEKAHASAWDLFLQVFDDGRLSDARGETVDFRHCIVILTSNLGSTIRQESGPGFGAHAAALTPQHVMRAINHSFRPELVNRLDRIIVFRPLGRDQMRSIVAKELSHVLNRRGLRYREWAVEWEASALEFLLDKGFSPAMGARPLKRAIDEHLLAPLAATLVEHRFPEGDQFLFVRSDGRALQVEFVDPDASRDGAPVAEAETLVSPGSRLTLGRMMVQPTGAATECTALVAETRLAEDRLIDQRWRSLQEDLERRMQQPDFWNAPDRLAILSRFEVMDRVKAAAATARSLAARLERSAGVSGRSSRELIGRLASQLFVVNHGIEDALIDAPVEVVLAVQPVLDRTTNAESGVRWCERLLDMYRKWSVHRGMHLLDVPGPVGRHTLLVISGFGAARLLAGESGLHVLDYEDGDDSGRTIARVSVTPTPVLLPQSAAVQYAALSEALDQEPPPSVVVRRYRLDASPVVRDVRRGWRTGRIDLVFGGHFDVIGDVRSTPAEGKQGRAPG